MPTPVILRTTRPPLDGYAAKRCATATHHRIATDPSLAEPDSPAALARMADGVAFEEAVGAELMATRRFVDGATLPRGVKALRAALVGVEALAVPACTRTAASKKRREALTVAAMAAGVQVIWNARLPLADGRVGEPDALVRVADQADGSHAYAPVDVKHHKTLSGTAKARSWSVSSLADPSLAAAVPTDVGVGTPRAEDDAQLAHYHRMLSSLGFASDGEVWGGIVGKERVVLWRRLDLPGRGTAPSALEAYDAAFALVADVAVQAVADPDAGPLVAPELKSECAECPWRTVCHDDLLDADDITLVPGITPARAKVHRDLGVSTRAQLAKLDWRTATLVDAGVPVELLMSLATVDATTPVASVLGTASHVTACHEVGIRRVGDAASLHRPTARYAGAKAWQLAHSIDLARVAKVGRVHRSRGSSFVALPRATFELDVDIEDADGRCYLIGVADSWRRSKDGSAQVRTDFHAFVDWSASDAGEARIFAEFWEYLCSQQAKAAANRWGFRAFHYTDHETRYFRHLAQKHAGVPGVPSLEELEAFLTSDAWVDLYKVATDELLWPTENFSVKSLAKEVGFSWRDEDPGGANSIAWYAQATGDPDPEVRAASRQRIIEYNEDDVLATLEIREWLSRLGETRRPGKRIPAADELDARFRRTRA